MQDKLKKITAYGSGLLVGTALAVIIPEGVRSLSILNPTVLPSEKTEGNGKQGQDDPFSVIGITLVLGFVFMLLVDQV